MAETAPAQTSIGSQTAHLPADIRPVAEARARVVLAYEAAAKEEPRGARGQLRRQFIADFNARRIPFEDDVYEQIGTLSEPKLKRWCRTASVDGLAGLAPQYGNRRNDGVIDRDRELRDWIVGNIAARPHISTANLMDGLKAAFKDRELPSHRTLQRWVSRFKTEYRRDLTAIADPDQWRSKYKAAPGSASEGIVRPNQLWELDSTLGDVLLLDPESGKSKRYALIKAVDVATRRALMLVARTSTAAAVAALMRKAILAWGVPERIKMDNGADYTSRAVESLLEGLGIERDLCPPFSPEKKPHVERAFKTFQHSVVEILPGYIGHNVADRKAIEARKAFAERLGESDSTVAVSMTPEEFQDICDHWCEEAYAHRVHSSLGRSPFEAAAAYTGPIRRIQDERALDFLLLPASGDDATRTITKKGIRIAGGHYVHEALGAMVGDQVRVLTDPADLGHVYVFDLDGRFLCEAINPVRRGISAEDIAARTKKLQKQADAEVKATMKALERQSNWDEMAANIRRDKAEAASNVIAGNFRPTAEHTTNALTEAGKAARSSDFAARQETSEEQAERAELAERLEEHASGEQITKISDRQHKFEWALAIERALEEGRDVDPEERRKFEIYSQSPEYRAERRVWALRQSGDPSPSEEDCDTG